MSGGKILLLASLQQTCNEYFYLNINKSKLAFLLLTFESSQLENRRTSPCFLSFPCSPCHPCSPNLLHVLQSGIAGFNEFCSPAIIIIILDNQLNTRVMDRLDGGGGEWKETYMYFSSPIWNYFSLISSIIIIILDNQLNKRVMDRLDRHGGGEWKETNPSARSL